MLTRVQERLNKKKTYTVLCTAEPQGTHYSPTPQKWIEKQHKDWKDNYSSTETSVSLLPPKISRNIQGEPFDGIRTEIWWIKTSVDFIS